MRLYSTCTWATPLVISGWPHGSKLLFQCAQSHVKGWAWLHHCNDSLVTWTWYRVVCSTGRLPQGIISLPQGAGGGLMRWSSSGLLHTGGLGINGPRAELNMGWTLPTYIFNMQLCKLTTCSFHIFFFGFFFFSKKGVLFIYREYIKKFSSSWGNPWGLSLS